MNWKEGEGWWAVQPGIYILKHTKGSNHVSIKRESPVNSPVPSAPEPACPGASRWAARGRPRRLKSQTPPPPRTASHPSASSLSRGLQTPGAQAGPGAGVQQKEGWHLCRRQRHGAPTENQSELIMQSASLKSAGTDSVLQCWATTRSVTQSPISCQSHWSICFAVSAKGCVYWSAEVWRDSTDTPVTA